MTTRRAGAGPRRSGLTLVEVLLALALSVVILALVFSAHHAVVRALRAHGARSARAEAHRACARRTDEVRTAVALPGDTEPFLAEPRTNGYELVFTAARRPDAEAAARRHGVERLTYRAEARPDGLWTVRRIRETLRGPGTGAAPATTTVLRAAAAWEVRCYDGNTWHDRWPDGDTAPPFPTAVRLRVVLPADAGGPETERCLETPVPAGVVVGRRRGPAG